MTIGSDVRTMADATVKYKNTSASGYRQSCSKSVSQLVGFIPSPRAWFCAESSEDSERKRNYKLLQVKDLFAERFCFRFLLLQPPQKLQHIPGIIIWAIAHRLKLAACDLRVSVMTADSYQYLKADLVIMFRPTIRG